MNTALESKQPSRVEALDSTRGWAILAVIAIHISQAAQLTPGVLNTLAINGDMGVELFYVLSAYSLMMVLHTREMAGRLSIKGYFVRRLFRIVPMFWMVLFLSIALYFGKQSYWSPAGIGWKEVVLTAALLHGLSPESVNAVIPGGWSVAVEVMFYLCLPVFYKYGKSITGAMGWLLVCLSIYLLFGNVAQAHYDHSLAEKAQHLSSIYSWYMSLPAQLPVFMLGILAFHAVRQELFNPLHGYVAAGVGAVLLLCFPVPPEWHVRHLLWGVVLALFVVANVQRPVAVFDNQVLRAFGRISYSAYLLHFIVLTYIGKIFRHVEIPPEFKFVLLYFVVGGITYYLASWSYRVVELRGMKFGSEISRRFESVSSELTKGLHAK